MTRGGRACGLRQPRALLSAIRVASRLQPRKRRTGMRSVLSLRNPAPQLSVSHHEKQEDIPTPLCRTSYHRPLHSSGGRGGRTITVPSVCRCLRTTSSPSLTHIPIPNWSANRRTTDLVLISATSLPPIVWRGRSLTALRCRRLCYYISDKTM